MACRPLRLAPVGLLAMIAWTLTAAPLPCLADPAAEGAPASRPAVAKPLVVLSPGGRRVPSVPQQMAVSPDGGAVALTDLRSGSIYLFEGPDWMVRRHIRIDRTLRLLGMAFSADGGKLIALLRGGRLATWDIRTGKMTVSAEAIGLEGAIQRPAFSADATRIVFSTSDRQAVLYDRSAGKVLQTHASGKHYAVVAISDDGKLWATADRNPTPNRRGEQPSVKARAIVIRSADANKVVATVEGIQATPVAAFGPDGKWLAVASQDGRLALIDLAAGGTVFRCLHLGKRGAAGMAFSPDGTKLLVASGPGVMHLYDLAAEVKAPQPEGTEPTEAVNPAVAAVEFNTAESRVSDQAFSRDGRRVFAACSDGWLRVYDAATGKEADTPPGHTMPISGAAFLPGRRLLTADAGGLVLVRQWPDGKLLARRQLPMGVFGLALSPSRDRVAVSAQQGGYVWTLGRDAEPTRLKPQNAQPRRGGGWAARLVGRGFGNSRVYDRAVAWAADRLVVQFREGTYRYAPDTGEVLGHLQPGGLISVLSPGGQVEAAILRDRSTIVLRTTDEGREVATFQTPDMDAASVAPDRPVGRNAGRRATLAWAVAGLSRDGQWLLNAYRGGLVVQDALNGSLLWTRSGDGDYRKAPRKAVFCADQPLLALGTPAGRTEVINLLNGETLLTHDDALSVAALAFSPGGRHVAAGAVDGSVIIWALPEVKLPHATAEQLEELYAQLTAETAKQRYRATWAMVGLGEAAVAYLAETLNPAKAGGDEGVAEILAQLDAPKYADRTAAAEKLQTLGPRAAGAIRKALKGSPPAETRLKLENALQRLDKAESRWLLASPEARAVGVLERIASDAARKVLAGLAAGADDAPLTRCARDALARLGKAPAEKAATTGP